MRTFKDTFFETLDRPVKVRLCSHPDCGQAGEYPAPKSRHQLNEYYFFCLEHVREYNKAWNYFAGLSPEQIEEYIREATVWERPSWPMSEWGMKDKHIREKAMRDACDEPPLCAESEEEALPSAERDALATLELEFPVDFAAVKRKYRTLVKKHHPDASGGDPENEEKFKKISKAFAVLRKFFKKREGDHLKSAK